MARRDTTGRLELFLAPRTNVPEWTRAAPKRSVGELAGEKTILLHSHFREWDTGERDGGSYFG